MGISSGGSGRPFPLGPALVQTRTTCQGQPGALRALWVGGSEAVLGARAPRCPPGPGRGRGAVLRTLWVVQALTRPRGAAPRCPCPAGVPISPEKWGEKKERGQAPGPPVLWPAFAARSFWRSCRIVPVMGLFRRPSSYPDLGTFFHKMLFQHIFTRKCVPNRS